MNRRTPEWALDSGPIDQLVVAVQEKPKPEAGAGMTEQSKDALWKALAEAQDRAKAVGKDARNEFARYDYASSEAIIIAANEQLKGSGLSLTPTACGLEAFGENWLLRRSFRLSHSSGEFVELSMDFPVVLGKGKPLDKAYAASLTSSFAYFLRDLLRLPRVDQADDELHHEEPERRPAKDRKERRPTPQQQHDAAHTESEERRPTPKRDTGRTKSEERRAATAEFDQKSKDEQFDQLFKEVTAKHPNIGPLTKIDRSMPFSTGFVGLTLGECVEWQERCVRDGRACWPDINGADKAVVIWGIKLHKLSVKGAA